MFRWPWAKRIGMLGLTSKNDARPVLGAGPKQELYPNFRCRKSLVFQNGAYAPTAGFLLRPHPSHVDLAPGFLAHPCVYGLNPKQPFYFKDFTTDPSQGP